QPLVPRPPGMVQQAGQAPQVPIDPEVVEMALQPTPKPGVLHDHLLMPLAAAPSVDGLDGPSQSCTPRLARQIPATPPGPPPIQRKAQEVKGIRTTPPLLRRRRPPDVEQTSLVRMEGQSVTLHPLVQHRQDALGILAVLKTDDKVLGVPDEAGSATQAWQDLPVKPPVQHVVQVDGA